MDKYEIVKPISPEAFNTLLLKYDIINDGKLLLRRLEKSVDCNLEVQQIIQRNFYIQCALCEMMFTGNQHANISVPKAAFLPDEYCTVFEDIVLLSAKPSCITCDVRTPVPGAMQCLKEGVCSEWLHPLMKKGLSYFQLQGQIPADYQPVFMKYNLCDDAEIDDLLITSASAWQNTGLIIVPSYMPRSEIAECGLLAKYNSYFDDMILVGHMASDSFVCHAVVFFFEKKESE